MALDLASLVASAPIRCFATQARDVTTTLRRGRLGLGTGEGILRVGVQGYRLPSPQISSGGMRPGNHTPRAISFSPPCGV
jgi:hypothetical protein